MMTQRYAHLRDETLKKASKLTEDIIYEIGRTKKSEKLSKGTMDE